VLGNDGLWLLAIESGFCIRKSKLTPEVFFDLLFYASSLSQNSSLEHLVSRLEKNHGIDIKKQSLDERFSEKTVNFVKSVLKRLIYAQFSDKLIAEGFLPGFNHLRIKDSTSFKVPDNLAANYSGNGGGIAGISIQYEFCLKTGKFLDLTITEASRNDQRDASETVENISENDLVLRDMGYFSQCVFWQIDEANAFFLSRLPSNVTVYDENWEEIDFGKLKDFMTKNKIDRMEKEVFIGETGLPVRLMIGLVPPEVYAERIRRKAKEEKKKGRKTQEKTKLMQNFNLYITNTDDQQLPVEKIMPLYRFRWQVELQFKNWKSLFSIHTLQKMKEDRYITMLYTRLILIVVCLQITNRVQSLITKQGGGNLSYKKALQTLKNNYTDILKVFRVDLKKAAHLLANIYRTLSKNHWRERRNKRENFIENICLFICISEL
jgi:hypothetical protein